MGGAKALLLDKLLRESELELPVADFLKSKAADQSHWTMREAVSWIKRQPRWRWTDRWWQLGCIVVSTGDKSWQVSSPDEKIPKNVCKIGCSGHDELGILFWIGFDLDVNHGKVCYPNYESALADARRLRQELRGQAEIRRSTSGNGLHVRHPIHSSLGLKRENAGAIAKCIAQKLSLRADPNALGRQVFWLWVRDPNPRTFQLVEGLGNA